MSLLSLIFRQPTKAQVGVLLLDASLNESHSRSATVTDHEIEDGTNISDHIRLNPDKLIIQGLISDVPLSTIGLIFGTGISALTGGVKELIPGGFGTAAAQAAGLGLGSLAGLITGTPRDPSDAFKYLEELFNDRQKFTVVTKLKRYDSMVIENLDVPRNSTVGGGLEFTIAMKKIKIVKSATVLVPAFSTRAAGASSKNKSGKQATKESDSPAASLLAQAFDKGKELFSEAF